MSLRKSNPNFWLVLVLMAILLGIVFFFPYIKTPINTRFFLAQLPEAREMCLDDKMVLSSVKLVEYNKLKGEAKVYCLYNQPQYNRVLTLSKIEGNWKLSREIKFTETGEFIWPYYN